MEAKLCCSLFSNAGLLGKGISQICLKGSTTSESLLFEIPTNVCQCHGRSEHVPEVGMKQGILQSRGTK